LVFTNWRCFDDDLLCGGEEICVLKVLLKLLILLAMTLFLPGGMAVRPPHQIWKVCSCAGGVFPLEIATLEKFTMLLEEPETNVTLADTAFTPYLVKLHVYPLSRLK